MKFQKIEGFKKMTDEAMKNTFGGGNTDTMSQKTTQTTFVSTGVLCSTGSSHSVDSCTVQDIKSVSLD